MQNASSAKTDYKCKAYLVLALLFSDLMLNSFIESSVRKSRTVPLLGAQVILRLVTMFVVFLQMSGTFVFRYGLLGVLLRRFRTLLLLMPAAFVVCVAFRVYRLVLVLGDDTVVAIWDSALYRALYALHTVASLAYYTSAVYEVHRMGDRDLYRPSAWLK